MKLQSYLLAALSVQLIGTSARPHALTTEVENANLAARDESSLPFFDLLPRLSFKSSSSKTSPKVAPPKAPVVAPAKSPVSVKQATQAATKAPVVESSKAVSQVVVQSATKAATQAVSQVSSQAASKVSSQVVSQVSSQASASASSALSAVSGSTAASAASQASTASAASSAATASGSSAPAKCITAGCGQSCPVSRRSVEEEHVEELGLLKRAFTTPSTAAAFNGITRRNGNTDISAFDTRNTQFIAFDGKTPQSVTAQNLEGCSVIAAFSSQGMQISHIFESAGDANGGTTGVVDLADTLHPNFVQATANALSALFTPNKAKFTGGQVVWMIPNNPSDPTTLKYVTEPVDTFNAKTSKFTQGKAVAPGQTIMNAINGFITSAIGITPQEAKYTPQAIPLDVKVLPPIKKPAGTFVIQYDPNNAPGTATPQAVQAFVEGVAVGQPLRFA